MTAVRERRSRLDDAEASSGGRHVEGVARVHYLDNLRALAMMLGVFLHSAFAYASPSQSFWLATDRGSSVAIDAWIWFVHLFRMGLFFLISGYFAKLALERYGIGKFLWQRTVRLVFPFVLFYPFLWAAMGLLIAFGLTYVEEPKGLMGLIAGASERTTGLSGESESWKPPETMHLWFLYYLIYFTAIGAVVPRYVTLSWTGLLSRPWVSALAPLILVPAILRSGVPLPGPESFVPTWWPFAFYGVFYAIGWGLPGRENPLESIRPYLWHIVIGSVLLFVPYYFCMPNLDLVVLVTSPSELPLWRRGVSVVLTAYLSVFMVVASLLLGKQYLSRRNAALRFVADASYWVYLVHLPIVIFLQTVLIPLPWSVWLKLPITIAATTLFCFATYVVFVRYSPIGWLLHGPRSFP